MAPETLFSHLLLLSRCSFVICNHIHWLKEAQQRTFPVYKAHLVLPYHVHHCEGK